MGSTPLNCTGENCYHFSDHLRRKKILMKNPNDLRLAGSFRDPSGFLFLYNNVIHRQINSLYQPDYDLLMESGLYKKLVDQELLVPHHEADIPPAEESVAYKVIKPENIPFISYPYEWCFSQLKSAAATTLLIQKIALEFGMTLKDASAYNIQFRKGKPVLIDTLSFEKYQEGKPWVAYRQFCQHFLAPIALMAMNDVRLNQLSRIFIDGIPLDLASALLPKRSMLKFGILSHIHLHAKSQKYFGDKKVKSAAHGMSKTSLVAIIDSLETTIRHINWKPEGTEWGNYYKDTNYTSEGIEHKKRIVAGFLDETSPATFWDLGANTGVFSRIASDRGLQTIAYDIDPAAVEKNHLQVVKNGEENILPLLMDLSNPSAGIGWGSEERMSLIQRGPADTVFALALIHHLAISNNVPFHKLAAFFNNICRSLIIEFVPKDDSQVSRLLLTRDDIFTDYNQENFEYEFNKFFIIKKSVKISDSQRILYLMTRREA